MDTEKKTKVFISYSHSDIEFVRQLDASFFVRNVETFLDERDIQVGDSIPDKIYDGIAKSNYLATVMSNSSIQSSWVKEELSIAKIKEKKNQGFKILPILIDEIEVPIGLAHIKYADFRNWNNPYLYRSAFLALLKSISIEPKLFEREELIWYTKYSGEILKYYRLFLGVASEIKGGWLMASDPRFTHVTRTEKGELNVSIPSVNEALQMGVPEKLENLYTNILGNVDEEGDTILGKMKIKVNKARLLSGQMKKYQRWPLTSDTFIDKDYPGNVSDLQNLLLQIARIIDDIRNEVEITIMSAISK